MKASARKQSIFSFLSIQRHLGHLRKMPQFCVKYCFSPSEAHTPFLKSRLYYVIFMLFYFVYVVSPLKVCADRTLKGLLQDSEAASIQIVLVERVLNLITNRLSAEALFSFDDADVEVMVKKKRALLRAFTIFFLLLMAITTHIAARYSQRSDHIMLPKHFPQSHNAEHISIAEVYRSPHSGLAPPCLLS